MKLLKNGNWRYRNCTIQSTPLGKYPEMVTIVSVPTRLKLILNKKFINLQKTKIAIETEQAECLIDNGGRSVNDQLKSLQLGSELNY